MDGTSIQVEHPTPNASWDTESPMVDRVETNVSRSNYFGPGVHDNDRR